MKKVRLKEVNLQLRRGGVGVMPTDTLYGIVASALNKRAVERVYQVRRRNPKKPCIILISAISDLALFDISINQKIKKQIDQLWPGRVSIVLPCKSKRFTYLHRGTKSLAFRLPRDKWLRDFLKTTGPLIAPSANHEGKEPAYTISKAKKYFTDEVDFYVQAGRRQSAPSTLVDLRSSKMIILRQGARKIQKRVLI